MLFSPYLGIGCRVRGGGGHGGVPGAAKRLGHSLLRQVFNLRVSSIINSKTSFFDMVTKRNHHPTCVTNALGSIYVLFTLFGYRVWGRGECLPRDWYTTC